MTFLPTASGLMIDKVRSTAIRFPNKCTNLKAQHYTPQSTFDTENQGLMFDADFSLGASTGSN
jgi:hypothetical protein